MRRLMLVPLTLGLVGMSGCFFFPKLQPPVAPCVYLVTAAPGQQNGAYSVPDQWDAEAPIQESKTTVSFVNCYTGQPVTVHGPYSVEKLPPPKPKSATTKKAKGATQ